MQYPRRRTALLVDTGLLWLHTRQARDQLFLNFGEFQAKLAAEVFKLGAYLLPSGVRISADPWRFFLAADQHRIEASDAIEQAMFCNLLRFNAHLLIAASGRAGVDSSGVESTHSRLVLDGAHFPCRAWISTSSEHIDTIAAYLRKFEGIPQLDFLEVAPQTHEGSFVVKTTLMDGQFLLSSVRASALLYQALFLRARRFARDGLSAPSISQHIVERNRSRVAAFGTQAMVQPGHKSAAQALIALVEDLRNELQALEAEFEEFQSVVLGLSLRGLGYPAVRNENDLFRDLMRQSPQDGAQFATWITQHLVSAKATDLLSQRNYSRQPQVAETIAQSWKQWLASTRPTAAKPVDYEREPGQRTVDSRRYARKGPQESQAVRANPATRLLDALRPTKGRTTATDRVEALDNFSRVASPEQLGFLASRLPPEQRSELQQLLAPGSDKCKASQPSSLFWQDPVASASLQEARNKGMSWFAVESAESDEMNLKAWVCELRKQTPMGLELFVWRRRHFAARVRQELLLTKNKEA